MSEPHSVGNFTAIAKISLHLNVPQRQCLRPINSILVAFSAVYLMQRQRVCADVHTSIGAYPTHHFVETAVVAQRLHLCITSLLFMTLIFMSHFRQLGHWRRLQSSKRYSDLTAKSFLSLEDELVYGALTRSTNSSHLCVFWSPTLSHHQNIFIYAPTWLTLHELVPSVYC